MTPFKPGDVVKCQSSNYTTLAPGAMRTVLAVSGNLLHLWDNHFVTIRQYRSDSFQLKAAFDKGWGVPQPVVIGGVVPTDAPPRRVIVFRLQENGQALDTTMFHITDYDEAKHWVTNRIRAYPAEKWVIFVEGQTAAIDKPEVIFT
jgi:hypothetical protein